MNYLQLCQRTAVECGIAGGGPTAVMNQTGEMLRVVNWVAQAWRDIQNSRSQWRWNWQTLTKNLSAGGRIFNPATDLGITVHDWDYETCKLYNTSLGVSDEMFLVYQVWDRFKQLYDWGPVTVQRPTVWTKRPDDQIMFNYQLDIPYTLHINYWQPETDLSNATDTPSMPTRYHDAIVWKAGMYYAMFEEAPMLYDEMQRKYREALRMIEQIEMPPVMIGDPLV